MNFLKTKILEERLKNIITDHEQKLKLLQDNLDISTKQLDFAYEKISKQEKQNTNLKLQYTKLETEYNKVFIELKSIEIERVRPFKLLFKLKKDNILNI